MFKFTDEHARAERNIVSDIDPETPTVRTYTDMFADSVAGQERTWQQ
mgnify:CR=1 FL=1